MVARFALIRTLTLFLALAIPHAWPRAQDVSPAQARLRADVAYLADDAREGRGQGTAGIEAAAAYIADQFQKAGLKPAPGDDGYFEPFEIRGDLRLTESSPLTFHFPGEKTASAEPKADFNPLDIGGGGTLQGVPLVFAGYGITAKDDSRGVDYDDYAGIDAKGKAILILRRDPWQGKPKSPFDADRPTSFATFRHKATNAFQHGAAAVLVVNDLGSLEGGKDELLNFDDPSPVGATTIPVLMLTRGLADKLLADAGQPDLKGLEESIGTDFQPKSRALEGVTLDGSVAIARSPYHAKNVVGVLEGSGPLAEETIVIGAHYDHLGHGGYGSLAAGSHAIHNGADDNASGTAMVMEMARRLAARKDPLPRRVVFIAFSGEERGLLGSKYYVAHPLFPLNTTVAMMNFDMVGRLNEKNVLTVYGSGTTPGLDALVEALGKSEGFTIRNVLGVQEYFGASDHASFYEKGIPVLFAFTGVHPDYHRPTDDTETINFSGMARIADFAELLTLDLVRRPERPRFTKLVNRPRSESPAQFAGEIDVPVYLGTRPAYGLDVVGVPLDGVSEGSPAEKAGLKGGDVIIRFADKPIATIDDYMESLSRQKPGDVVEIVVNRDGKETTLKATLGTRSSASRQ